MTYGDKEYSLQMPYWKPEEAVEYGHEPYELTSVILYEQASGDALLLYTNEPQKYTENQDIRSFLLREYDMAQYITVDLPEGLTQSSFKKGINSIWDGCIFEGDYQEPPHGQGSCPEAWYAPGGIGVYDLSRERENGIERITFEEGRLTAVAWDMNHGWAETEGEYLEGCQRQAMLYEYSFDLFTAAESAEYMEKYGLAYEELQTVSRYWYVFFAEPDSEYLYAVYLNREYFTKEDVIELAKSAEFVR